jgi:hypothetical protein
MGLGQGYRSHSLYNAALTTAAGETTLADEIYLDSDTQGLIFDVYHTSALSGTMVYKIYAMPFTDGNASWVDTGTAPVVMLTSTTIAKNTNVRLVIDPRVTAVSNTHAQTVLPYKIKITGTAATNDNTGVFVSMTAVP